MRSIGDRILTRFFMWNKYDRKSTKKITKEIIECKGSDKAVIYFPYWTGNSKSYKKIAKKLPNHTHIFYDFPNEVLSKDIKVSLNYLIKLFRNADKSVKLLRKMGYKEITLVGSSLGSNIALKLATLVKVDKIILNTIDRNIALEIFTSPALKKLKSFLTKKEFTYDNLEKIYKFISNKSNLKKIKNKDKIKLLIFISKRDIFCPKEQVMIVIDELNRLNIQYKLKECRFFGHVLCIYKNLFFNKKIIRFIKE